MKKPLSWEEISSTYLSSSGVGGGSRGDNVDSAYNRAVLWWMRSVVTGNGGLFWNFVITVVPAVYRGEQELTIPCKLSDNISNTKCFFGETKHSGSYKIKQHTLKIAMWTRVASVMMLFSWTVCSWMFLYSHLIPPALTRWPKWVRTRCNLNKI